MPKDAVDILPLLSLIKPNVEPDKMKHVACADDLAGGSKLEKLRNEFTCLHRGHQCTPDERTLLSLPVRIGKWEFQSLPSCVVGEKYHQKRKDRARRKDT